MITSHSTQWALVAGVLALLVAGTILVILGMFSARRTRITTSTQGVRRSMAIAADLDEAGAIVEHGRRVTSAIIDWDHDRQCYGYHQVFVPS